MSELSTNDGDQIPPAEPSDTTSRLSGPLGEKAVVISRLLEEGSHDFAMNRYLIGGNVREIEDNPALYGKDGLERIARVIRKELSSLYDCGRVHRIWGEDEIKDWTGCRPTGQGLCWSHIVAVSRYDLPKSTRISCLREAVENGWTAHQLIEVMGQRHSPGKGKASNSKQSTAPEAANEADPSPRSEPSRPERGGLAIGSKAASQVASARRASRKCPGRRPKKSLRPPDRPASKEVDPSLPVDIDGALANGEELLAEMGTVISSSQSAQSIVFGPIEEAEPGTVSPDVITFLRHGMEVSDRLRETAGNDYERYRACLERHAGAVAPTVEETPDGSGSPSAGDQVEEESQSRS